MTGRINYSLLANPDQLAATMQLLDDRQLAAAAHCTVETVWRWQRRLGVTRETPEPEPEPVQAVDRRAVFRDVVGRAYWQADKCWAGCLGRENCIDEGCRYGGGNG